MKKFLKVFAISALSIFAIVSFIRFDINIAKWDEAGRGAFLFFTLLFSGVACAILESEELNK
jgi:hypothetical protein